MDAASYDVTEKSISELQAAMTSGQVTSAQIVQAYLDRIAAYDQVGPAVNAVVYVNPRALNDARALDDERSSKGARGPLHGIPVLLKDNYDTKDMPTTGASLALSGLRPTQDAFQVARLRQAGVVLLGKVNLHELALGLTTVSSLGGQTRDPYDLTRAPGGSSGGSGVAAAVNFAAFAMGTDTSGSIRVPSAHNSLFGLRPSAGLSSRKGIIPFGYTQDTGGPLARSVTDIALVLDATAGFDPADPVTAASKGKIPPTYTSSLKREALRNARIGILNQLFGDAPEDQEVGGLVRRALDDMRTRGATLVDVAVPDLTAQLTASNLLSQELKFYLRDYLQAAKAPVRSVEELLASGLHTAQIASFLEGANALPEDYLAGDDYKSRLAARTTLAQTMLKLMDDNSVDALAYPVARRIAPVIGGNQVGSNAGLSAQSGFPAMAVPVGFTPAGFPVGLELLGRAFAEPTLIGLGYAYEQASRRRRAPTSTPAVSGLPGPVSALSSSDTGPGSVAVEVTATGSQSVPPSEVPFQAIARFSFNDATRQLGYDVTLAGASPDHVAGVYLHQRASRPNGGVAYILAKSGQYQASGKVTLLETEAADLKAGKFYVAAISTKGVLLSARGNITLPVG